MRTEIRHYSNDTQLRVAMPWGGFIGGRALCADGKVRALSYIAQTADTFFSVPASVKVQGKTVSGFVTVECVSGSSVVTDDAPAVVRFFKHTNGKHAHLLPPNRYED